MSFKSGKHTFELTSLGSGHGTDMLAMVTRPENVAYIVDVVSPGRMAFKDFAGIDIDAIIDQIKKVEQLKFDIVANLDTSAYKHLLAYEKWRNLNIQGMARYL